MILIDQESRGEGGTLEMPDFPQTSGVRGSGQNCSLYTSATPPKIKMKKSSQRKRGRRRMTGPDERL